MAVEPMTPAIRDWILRRLKEMLRDENMDPISLHPQFLEEITKNFSEDEEIGRGVFGAVYKGRLPNGQVVAVKRIDTSKMRIDTSENKDKDAEDREREIMKKAKHKNVVRLLGYYWEKKPDEKNVVILCSEYMPNGNLSRYLEDTFCRFQWSTRYQIILGICEGVEYLHGQDKAIVHRDLKPDNIVLDHNMVPKITDFGLSKLLDVDKSHGTTFGRGGPGGRMAPEIYCHGLFSTTSDIYCLGFVIMDLLMKRNYNNEDNKFRWRPDDGGHDTINKVLQKWTILFETQETNNIPQLQNQVKVCAVIAMLCLDILDPEDVKKYMANDNNMDGPCYMIVNYLQRASSDSSAESKVVIKRSKQRPNATEIVGWLRAAENWSSTSMSQHFQLNLSTESAVLDIHPRVLCFHFGAHVASSCCVLNLTNNSSDLYVGFWIQIGTSSQLKTRTQQGIIDCTYDGSYIVGPSTTKAVTAELHNVIIERKGYPPVDTGRVNILTVTMTKEQVPFAKKIGRRPTKSALQSLGGEVHEALLAVVVCPLSSKKKIPRSTGTMDVHPTKPWILINEVIVSKKINEVINEDRRVSIWNYQKEKREKVYEHKKSTMVILVKFIPRDGEHRIVMGDSAGFIYVISWTNNNRGEIMKTLCRPGKEGVGITSLAIHPEEPLLLWADDEGIINLQSWQEGQTYIRTFEGRFPRVTTQVKFHPKDKNSFIQARNLIKVWKINSISTQPTTVTLGQKRGNVQPGGTERCHPIGLFDYPYTDSGRHHTIAILREGGAEIWDLDSEAEHKVGELSFDIGALATAIACHPIHPVIVLGTKDRVTDTVTISLYKYNSNNYRVEKMIKCTRDAHIQEFGFLSSKWLVVRYSDGQIEVLEIDMAYLQ